MKEDDMDNNALQSEAIDLRIPIDEVFDKLRCIKSRLSSEGALQRLDLFGPNKLEKKEERIPIDEVFDKLRYNKSALSSEGSLQRLDLFGLNKLEKKEAMYVLYELGNNMKALHIYMPAATIIPRDAFGWEVAVPLGIELGNYVQARNCFKTAITANTEVIGLRFSLECASSNELPPVEYAAPVQPEQQEEEYEMSDNSDISGLSEDEGVDLQNGLNDDYYQNLWGKVSNGKVGIWVDTTKHANRSMGLISSDTEVLKLVGGVSKYEIDSFTSLTKAMHREWIRYTKGLERKDIMQVTHAFPGYQVLCLHMDNEENSWRVLSPLALEFYDFIDLLTMIKLRPPEYYFLALTVSYNTYQGPREGAVPILISEPEMEDLLIMEIEISDIVSSADFKVEIRRCYETYSGLDRTVREDPTWDDVWPGSTLRYLDRDGNDLIFGLQWPQVQDRLASIRVCREEFQFPDLV